MKRSLIGVMLLAASSAASAQYRAASSYMHTLIMNEIWRPPEVAKNMREAEARVAAQSKSASNGAGKATTPTAPATSPATIGLTDVSPSASVRSATVGAVLDKVPAGPKREQMRQGLEAFTAAIESGTKRSNNVAQMAYVVVAFSLQALNGTTLDGSKSDAVIQNINNALATDANFLKLDAAQRTKMYYALLTTAAVTFYLSNSPAADEKQAGKTLAKSTLQAFGFKV